MADVFLGIDVGTTSARAGLFNAQGRLLGAASHPIRIWKPEPDHVEQSSEDIWASCGRAVRSALRQAGVSPSLVAGIGFDATCSLVVLDEENRPIPVGNPSHPQQNVIVWMDHRAIPQADRINRKGHPVLRYVGGAVSPEMQTPKLLWLKENLPDTWKRAARFLDLPDYLTYQATGDDTRSLCTTACKWTYLGHQGGDGRGWDAGYFNQIGLGELAEENWRRIGTRIRPMGEPLSRGLSRQAAKDLGLAPGIPVGVSIIDAHAGGLGVLGARLGKDAVSFESRLALIGGTSTCHMAVSPHPRFIRGIWGPSFSAMIPGLWLTEGGQSATGALIDHLIFSHAASAGLQQDAHRQGKTIYELLNRRLAVLAATEHTDHTAELTRNFHIQPDFHGNRSPHSDPSLRGTISGLPLSATPDDLARQYLATIQALAYGTRHIIGEMNRKGYRINTLLACGGGTKNPVFLREHADITGCRIVLPKEPEAVLLGSAILGAVASGRFQSVVSAMAAMNKPGTIIRPAGKEVQIYHQRKYQVFHRMHRDFLKYRNIMDSPQTNK